MKASPRPINPVNLNWILVPASHPTPIMARSWCGVVAGEVLSLRLLMALVASTILVPVSEAYAYDPHCAAGRSNALDVFHRCSIPEASYRSPQIGLDFMTQRLDSRVLQFDRHHEGPTHFDDNKLTGRYGIHQSRQLLQSNSSGLEQEVQDLRLFTASVSADPLGTLRDWSENASTPCNWTGISCSSDGRSVIAVDLPDRQLVGNVGSALLALSRLSSLVRVNLAANSFGGSMPGNALGNWSSLSYLNISSNQVTGAIPSQVGELVNLETLDLQSNNLTGGIPTSICNCTALKTLDLGTNLLAGSIPDQIGRLSNLEVLNLGTILPDTTSYKPDSNGNQLRGTIPSSLGNCTSLKVLSLQKNTQLGGEIPPSLSQLTNLQLLNLSVCNFEGQFPAWILNLTDLRMIGIRYSQLHGHIPTDIGNLGKLSFVNLADNNISGVIPPSILNCTSLTILGLQNNVMLTGDIPSNIGVIKNLRRLTIWSTGLTGILPRSLSNCSAMELLSASDLPLMDPQPMPTWLGSLPNLWILFLNDIKMYGPIPRELGRLSKLVSLSIYGNQLSGSIPPELGNCTSLEIIQVGDNPLTGSFPPEIGNLAKLRQFSVGYNDMSGPLPASLANLTSITLFDVSRGMFNGTIDGYWGRLPKLDTLLMGINEFVGSVPAALGNSTTLFVLDLSANKLTGEIPPSLGNITSLSDLVLAQNQIAGTIPPELGNLTDMFILDLGFNILEGSIPSSLGDLLKMQQLYLGANKLSGIVPASFVKIPGLLVLDLSHNLFSGSIPADVISKLDSLVFLNLSSNQFFGSWPMELSNLAYIQELNISGNSLSGPLAIDDEASGSAKSSSSYDTSWTSLVKLDISRNNFDGGIPESLGSLPLLIFFNASYNNFQGQIPDAGVFESNLTAASFLGNPQLCGSVLGPGRECRNSSGSCSGFHCKRVWIPTLCGGVVVIGLLMLAIWLLARATRGKREKRKKSQDVNVIFDPAANFSTDDVLRNIHPSHIIRKGSISVVYKGSFPGSKTFAVKVLSKGFCAHEGKGNAMVKESEMVQEVRIMANLRHRNILKVVGCCSHKETKALILEYMPEGTLCQHLHGLGDGTCRLSWQRRLDIALGVAEGMKYLHHDFPEPLIHGDLKPSNILLDTAFVPKVADFGLSKFVSPHREGQASASAIWGTIGYIPPEYALGTVVSTKGDVYSYGIVLLELLSGRSPSTLQSTINFDPGVDYRSWAVENYYQNPTSLVDSTLQDESMTDYKISEQTRLMLLVALLCTREAPQSRPTMRDVLTMLMDIRGVKLNPVERRSLAELAQATPDRTYTMLAHGIPDHRFGSWSLEDPNGTSSPSSISDRSS